jgi:SAM-dependent methyltransferase
MLSVFRYHEISERGHRIMNPFSVEKLLLLGEICRARPGVRLLDLACGKGELLCLFAERFGATGTGIDIHPAFLAAARERALELGVEGAVRFDEGDAGHPNGLEGRFDVVSCLGASWIGGGLSGTLKLMDQWLAPGGWLLVGEPYWASPPRESVRLVPEAGEGFADLAGTLERFEAAAMDLVEMVLATTEDFDRYAASQWLSVSDWLLANPGDPEAREVREQRDASRRDYLSYERACLSWGVFVLRSRLEPPAS